MALTVAGTQLTRTQQAAQLAHRAQTLQGLLRLWALVDVENLPGTIDTFAQAAAILAGEGFDSSAATAATYYGLFRLVEGVGSIIVPKASRPAVDWLAGQLRGSALRGIIDARKAGMSLGKAKTEGFVRVSGEMTKLVLAGGRMTITGAVQRDRQALGWARATTGDPCAFCRMLASRGPVYKSEKSADFEAHDHDACMPEPVYRGDPVKLGAAEQSATYLAEYKTAQEWARTSGTMSAGTSNNALNNYRRWLDNGSPQPGADDGAAGAGSNGGNPGDN